MSLISKIFLFPKAWLQLGPETIWLYTKYQFKLRSGWLRLRTPGDQQKPSGLLPEIVVRPAKQKAFETLLGERVKEILAQADEILDRKVRLFGSEPRNLELHLPQPLQHWTRYHSHLSNGEDIKPIWEVGRFSWATALARAYWLSKEDRFAEGFWKYFEEFSAANPSNNGPHWSSAQEVALRLISLAFCYSLIADSSASTENRKQRLADSAIVHAVRIPPTLDYSRAQNNNHLLSEALSLVTAAALVPDHPRSAGWRSLGRALFDEGIEKQIHDDGAYAQHSANYHRLMLQLGCWARVLSTTLGEQLAEKTRKKLALATHWLLRLLDESGRVPNLGPNDGAYILPLSVLPFDDFRPILQAGTMAFSGQGAIESGAWDEMALWLGIKPDTRVKRASINETPIRLEGKKTWAYFRIAEFKERPGHADQLHLDIWWRGLNVAQDAGSYLYTAPSPWDNALACAKVHNSITINGQEPMMRAGRFLWLDWAQPKNMSTRRGKDGQLIAASAEHHGYQKLNVTHRREVSRNAEGWVVTDRLLPIEERNKPIHARLHWLLPDWDWQVDTHEIRIESPHGEIQISVDVSVGDLTELIVMRAGELVHGIGPGDPVLGWISPTYGVKIPALSFIVDALGPLPITMVSTWTFPE